MRFGNKGNILQMRYYFTVFCGFITVSAFIIFAASCRQQEPEPEAPIYEEAEFRIQELSGFFQDGNDIILSSYRDLAIKEKVLAFFEDLTGSSTVAEVVLENASHFNIAPAMAFSLCAEESGYNIQAFNRNRNETVDRGLFQLNSASFPYLKVVEFYKPELNAMYGLAHLRWCLDTAGTEVAALAMYNAGMTRVHTHGTPKQTLDYVSRILSRQRRIENLFLDEYHNIIRQETTEEAQKAPFRLSLLMPLGGR